jgi:hypothetical protein
LAIRAALRVSLFHPQDNLQAVDVGTPVGGKRRIRSAKPIANVRALCLLTAGRGACKHKVPQHVIPSQSLHCRRNVT